MKQVQSETKEVLAADELASQIVGLHKDMAFDFIKMHNIHCRITKVDGQFSPAVTRDFRKDRINLEVEGDLVQRAYVG